MTTMEQLMTRTMTMTTTECLTTKTMTTTTTEFQTTKTMTMRAESPTRIQTMTVSLTLRMVMMTVTACPTPRTTKMIYNPQPASHLHVAIPKTIQSRRCRIPNLPAADVDAHRGRLLRRLRLVHRQQAHLRSCTNAATHPEDAVKLFQPLS